jgi:hypothetical protein
MILAAQDRNLVRRLCAVDHGLSEWEVDFVESIAHVVEDEGRMLSPDQRHKAEEILEKVKRTTQEDDDE